MKRIVDQLDPNARIGARARNTETNEWQVKTANGWKPEAKAASTPYTGPVYSFGDDEPEEKSETQEAIEFLKKNWFWILAALILVSAAGIWLQSSIFLISRKGG